MAGGETPEGTQGRAEGRGALQERERGEAPVETGDPQGGALATWKPIWQLRCVREERPGIARNGESFSPSLYGLQVHCDAHVRTRMPQISLSSVLRYTEMLEMCGPKAESSSLSTQRGLGTVA